MSEYIIPIKSYDVVLDISFERYTYHGIDRVSINDGCLVLYQQGIIIGAYSNGNWIGVFEAIPHDATPCAKVMNEKENT